MGYQRVVLCWTPAIESAANLQAVLSHAAALLAGLADSRGVPVFTGLLDLEKALGNLKRLSTLSWFGGLMSLMVVTLR